MNQPKKAVFIIAQNNFRDEEYFVPRRIFEKNNIRVTVASSALKPARGMLGAVVQPDILLGQINVADYDAIVFIGGSGSAQYWHDQQAQKIAVDAVAQGKVLAALCLAPVTLANAGVLTGKKCTVWPSERGQLEARGGVTTGRDLEIDGKIITASGPEAAEKFGQAIVNKLE
jgi:protease I